MYISLVQKNHIVYSKEPVFHSLKYNQKNQANMSHWVL